MNKYIKLLKNSGIFFLANMGSKLLTFLLVPCYTHVLSTEEYGRADIITTTVTMLVPLITLSISEAALRFAMEKEQDPKKVLSGCGTVLLIGNFFLTVFFPLIGMLGINGSYLIIFYLSLFTCSIHVVLSQFVRGIGYVKQFAIGGVLSTVALVTSNILLLLVFKLGVTGYLISIIASYVIPIIYYCFAIKIHKYIGKPSKELLKEMLIYSIPMIPNSFAWWAMTASDKYIIIYFLGSAANGIYVVAHKIPSIINIISSIFMQSWQISAVDESKSEDKSAFYSNIFNLLSTAMLIATSFLTAIIKPLYSVWLSDAYFDAWKCTTMLLLANTFSCFSFFVGTNYVAMKKTGGNLKTTIVGCIVNIVLNLILIPKFGLYAAGAPTLFAFFITFILRVKDTKHFVELKINIFKISAVVGIILIQYLCLFFADHLIIQAILLILVILVFAKDLKILILNVKNTFERKRNKNG